MDPAASARVPSGVPESPRSWTIRASIGKAVIDIAAPRYRNAWVAVTVSRNIVPPPWTARAMRPPSTKGTTMPAAETDMATGRSLPEEIRAELDPHEEHVEGDPELGDGEDDGHRGFREQGRVPAGRDCTEERRTQCHARRPSRPPPSAARPAARAHRDTTRRQDDSQLEEEQDG
jgi:hypothetical protein